MNMLLALLMLCSSIRGSSAPTDHGDMIEHHTMIDEDGKQLWSQYIVWEWNHEYGRYNVRGWVLDTDSQLVYRNGKYTLIYTERRYSIPDNRWTLHGIRVQADILTQTRETVDPEKWNAKVFDPVFRRPFHSRRIDWFAAPAKIGE